jgi:ATP-binding protein involved in chromosome partitioning
MDLFGSGGGEVVAATLSAELGTDVPLLGRVPFDVRLREGGDSGNPLVLTDPDAPASTVLREVATRLGTRARGLAGLSLGITPAGRL